MNSRHSGLRMVVIATVLAGLLFACLMAVRMGLFESPPVSIPAPPSDASARESWMTIWQSDRKIGYGHQRLAETETGWRLTDRTVMRVNTMGLVQDMDLEVTAGLNADLSLSAFDARLSSGRFSFSARGGVDGNKLLVSMEGRQLVIPMGGPLYLSAGIWTAAASAALAPGQSLDVPVFDPVSLGTHTVRITFLGREAVILPDGKKPEARKFSLDFKGAVETAWMDEDGTLLREEGLLGITLVKDTRENALDTQTLSGSRDLTLAASVAAGGVIDTPEALPRLELKIEGAAPNLLLDGGRQTFSDGVLSIVREELPDPPEIIPGEAAEFLAPTPFIQSDHPEIAAAAKTAVAGARRPLSKARNLVRWVHDTLEKRPALSVPTALETLRQRTGDCNEHTVLLAALARAAGIPARVEAGLVYMDGRFYYHAWNSLYLGRWVTADGLMNQLPADVTHVRLVQGAAADQADILGAIGRITISILDTSP